MPITYVVCIDFEATCWNNRSDQPQEIIGKSNIRLMACFSVANSKNTPPEFAGVFVDLTNRKTIGEFRKFLRPVENPELSQYCKRLTGIKQHEVDNGVLLEEALDKFHAWLELIEAREDVKLNFESSSRNAALVSWSNSDFGRYLKEECERKNISRKRYFLEWVDAQELYKVRVFFHGANSAPTVVACSDFD